MRAQVLLAAALPWLVGVVFRPDSRWWGAVVLLGVTAFAVLHRRERWVWVLVASAVGGVGALALDPVPVWYAVATGAIAIASALLVVLARRPTTATSGPRAATAIGWALVVTGVLTAGMGLLANRASDDQFDAGQADMAAQFDGSSSTPPVPSPSVGPGSSEGATSPLVGPVDAYPGDSSGQALLTPSTPAPSVRPPMGRLEFRRPGSDVPPVTSSPLYIGPDVTPAGLAAGPGHYPQTPLPGQRGNMAIAGHRTGWGSPFLHLDDLVPGDEIVLSDRDGQEFIYAVDLVTVVEPDSPWVLEPDPIGTGPRTLTLTTCDPPGTADMRLIVFATLLS